MRGASKADVRKTDLTCTQQKYIINKVLLFVLYVNNFRGLYDLVVKCIKYKLDLLFLRATGGGG